MNRTRRGPVSGDAMATLAVCIAASALAALGLARWSDGAHRYETPTWDTARFVELAPATGETREQWIVAVNLRCPHCKEHLRSLAHQIERRERPPSLAALIVDQRTRPRRTDLDVQLTGGAWWDSAQVWRDSWGRRIYDETFRFDAVGRLLSATPVGTLPDSISSRK